MKKLFLLILLGLAGVLTWYFFVTRKKPKEEGPRQQAVVVSQHSDSFNVSVNKVLTAYYGLSDALVNWDSAAANRQAGALKASLEGANFNELKKDTPIYQTALSYIDASKAEAGTIAEARDLTAKRRAFHNLSQNLYDLLRTIRFDEAKVYLQECPMAFNDEEQGLWLDKTEAIRNPYLGLHHPKYGKGMLECGSTKDTLNFTPSH
ncbi:DUF3347 domain-containing protein [Paraflavisolibacter sp. H34]|uniref:DUF3347 domain-containing protein n=1 Tax=Huijunlia imazamoxiresistens TaxID=3127457 RepID=UPI003015D2D7